MAQQTKELYVVIGTNKNGDSWACHDSWECYVFNLEEATELKEFIEPANSMYTYKVAKLSFLD